MQNKNEAALLSEAQQLAANGQMHQARNVYLKILQNNPHNDQALGHLANLHASCSEYHMAEKYLLNAIRINPDFIGYHINLGMVYCNLQQWEKAIAVNRSILQSDKNNFYALCNMGHALRGKGELEESIYFFKQLIHLRPGFTNAYVSLCSVYHRLHKRQELLDLLSEMEKILPSLNDTEKSGIHFTLGRYYDIFNKYETAFIHLEKANELKRTATRYNLDKELAHMATIQQLVTSEFIAMNRNCGNNDRSPIFIIGMPRSGTSLVEQILSCHPDVSGGGEMHYFYRLAQNFDLSSVKSSCTTLAENYLQAIAPHKKESAHITDKLPHNFLYAGLIHLCLPNAKIIHCLRDPIDTCFSCYKQDFRGGHHYSNDLQSLGTYYKAYQRHMAHWHTVLLDHAIFDLQYEKLIKNTRPEVQRILEYCNLRWHEGCLQFQKSSRYVTTASKDQVARPIYTDSIQRWKHYECHLGPLIEILKDDES